MTHPPPAHPIARLTLPESARVALLAGAAAGMLWGVVARVWMRFISAEHEFTWNGTLAIVMNRSRSRVHPRRQRQHQCIQAGSGNDMRRFHIHT